MEASGDTRGRIGVCIRFGRWGDRRVLAFGVLVGEVVGDFVEVVGLLQLTSGCSSGWAC